MVAGTLLCCTGGACFSGEGTPRSGPDKKSCGAGYPPADVRQPANTCEVVPLHVPDDKTDTDIPRQPAAGQLEVDLYIEGDHTCGIGPALCAVDDNRPFVAEGSPDPRADPTRNRVHMVVDFAAQTIDVQISPSCRIHVADLPVAGPVGFNGEKECFAPNDLGEGTELEVSSASSETVKVDLNVLQTAYVAPLRIGQVKNTFELTPHADGSIRVTLDGTNFPDLAVIRDGQVVCADRAEHLSTAIGPNTGPDTRSYSCTVPPTTKQGAEPKPAPVPGTGAHAVDPCVARRWRVTSASYGLDASGSGATELYLKGGAGEVLTVEPDGRFTDDLSSTEPAAATSGGSDYDLTFTGSVTGTLTTANGTLSVDVDDPSTASATLTQDGS